MENLNISILTGYAFIKSYMLLIYADCEILIKKKQNK